MRFLFKPDGAIRSIHSDEAAEFLKALSPSSYRCKRASHVEPHGEKWTADMSPSNGPVLGPFDTRAEALEAEVAWLREHGEA